MKLGTQVGKPGDTIALALHGFASGEPIKVYWNSLSDRPVATLQADGGGGVGQASLQVPFGAVGTNTFLFVGGKSQSLAAVSFQVLALYPAVTLSSYALKADNPLSFTGSGFGPGERVLVYANNPNGQPITVIPTDKSGSFKNAGSFLVPFALKGQQTLIFMGEQSRAPDAVSFTVLPYTPVVQPSTYGGFPGTTISFFVSGFARNEVVHVYARHTQQSMGTLVGCFATDDHGSASAAGAYVIPGDTPAGTFGFALQGVKSGGIGVASVNVTAPPSPVQTPAQPPFTCPLDQQQNQAPASGGSETPTTHENVRTTSLSLGGPQPQRERINGDARLASAIDTGSMVRVVSMPLFATTRGASALHTRALSAISRGEGLLSFASLRVAPLSFLGIFALLALMVMWRFRRRTPGQRGTPRMRYAEPHRDTSRPVQTPPTPAPTAPRARKTVDPAVAFPTGTGLTLASRYHTNANQDTILITTGTYKGRTHLKLYGLFIVTNGLGDTRRVPQLIADHVAALLASNSGASGSPSWGKLLSAAIMRADGDLRAWSASGQAKAGATVTAALLANGLAYIANIGDCRTYLFDPDLGLCQLTADHLLVSTLIASGLLPPDAIYTHPRRHQVYRWLGGIRSNAQIDTSTVILRPADQLMLCSDGFWRTMQRAEIESILRSAADSQTAAEQLAHRAYERGGGQDISVIVVRITTAHLPAHAALLDVARGGEPYQVATSKQG